MVSFLHSPYLISGGADGKSRQTYFSGHRDRGGGGGGGGSGSCCLMEMAAALAAADCVRCQRSVTANAEIPRPQLLDMLAGGRSAPSPSVWRSTTGVCRRMATVAVVGEVDVAAGDFWPRCSHYHRLLSAPSVIVRNWSAVRPNPCVAARRRKREEEKRRRGKERELERGGDRQRGREEEERQRGREEEERQRERRDALRRRQVRHNEAVYSRGKAGGKIREITLGRTHNRGRIRPT
jgi:hypothetical protein